MIYKDKKYHKVDTGGHSSLVAARHHLVLHGHKARILRQEGFSYDKDLWTTLTKKEYKQFLMTLKKNKDE